MKHGIIAAHSHHEWDGSMAERLLHESQPSHAKIFLDSGRPPHGSQDGYPPALTTRGPRVAGVFQAGARHSIAHSTPAKATTGPMPAAIASGTTPSSSVGSAVRFTQTVG